MSIVTGEPNILLVWIGAIIFKIAKFLRLAKEPEMTPEKLEKFKQIMKEKGFHYEEDDEK